jgi:hypothetical protein
MAKSALEKWHTFFKTQNVKILDELLAEDVVFYSPVVWTPQKGKMTTKAYLLAAAHVFLNGDQDFNYIREVVNDKHIILEFETVLDGITINGVDMIEINDSGKIQSFKVMVRPLKAVNKLHEKMAEMLQKMSFLK